MTLLAKSPRPGDDPRGSRPAAGAPEGEAPPGHRPSAGARRRAPLIALLALAALVLGGLWLSRRERNEPGRQASAPADRPGAPASPAPGAPPAVVFTDVAAGAGIGFVHFNGATGEKLLPESLGSGAAFFDLDRDEDPDLLLVNGTSWPHAPRAPHAPAVSVYRNLGGFRFEDVSATHGPGLDFYGVGVAVGDYDGDGWTDVFVTAVGENKLLRNVEGRLVDVTQRAGVAGRPDQWTTGAAFLDHDGDGDLDLFVCRYVKWSRDIDLALDYRLTGVGRAYGPPLNYDGSHSSLFRNDGNGTFTDVSAAAGIEVSNPATGAPVGKALAVMPLDADRDGRVDLLVANDTVRNFFFHNRGDGTFEEVGELWGLAYDREGNATGAMGIDVAHYRNDGELGYAIGNFANEMSSLYVSQGDPSLWVDEAIAEGIGAATRTVLTFGVLFLDYDLDGRLDLLQSNGHLEEHVARVDPSQTYRQQAQLFWNAGPDSESTFVLVPPASTGDLTRPIVGRGSAFADVDGDGDLDVVQTQVAGPPLVLRNDQRLGRHWLRVRLAGDGANTAAVGAWVEATAGGSTQRRQVMPTRSYLSQSELPVTFGLGDASAVDELVVTWPDGTRQEVPVPGVDRLIVVERAGGGGRRAP